MRVPFVVAPGIVSDDTTFASEGRLSDGNNMRPWRGSMQSVGGWQSAFSTALTGVCRNILPWTDTAGYLNIAFGTHSKLQVYFGGTVYDITPSGLAAGSIDSAGDAPGYGSGDWDEGTYSTPASLFYLRTWALDTWGQTLLGVPRGGTLYQWSNNTASAAAEITQAPNEITYMLVTQERQCLALGCNEESGGVFNPLCIRGCNLEDLTNWTTAATNNVFEHILEGGGHIVAGTEIGPYVAVWTDNGLHLGQFLGNPGQTYRFDLVDYNCGLIGPNAFHVMGQTAYWLAPDRQWRVWSPGTKPEIIPCPIRKDFVDNLHDAQAQKIVASGISQFGEIWWFYPDERDGTENSRYVSFNVKDALWFRGEIARTAFVDAGVAGHPIGVTSDGIVYHHENGTDANGSDLEWTLSAADSYLDEAGRFLQIQGIDPDFEDQQADVSLTLSVRKYPQATASEYGPYTLAVGAGKKDFRVSGRVVSPTFSGTGFVRFGKPVFRAVVTGQQ
jgi:hypothetical protein